MYQLGSQHELEALQVELENKLQLLVENPEDITEILQAIKIGLFLLDQNYGKDRDWEADGGYVAIFTDLTQDDNEELLALLAKYNQNLECMELDRTLATAVTEHGVVDWLSEIYLIGTEYGITVIRPRVRGIFDDKTPKYLSRQVADYVPSLFVSFFFQCIEQMRKKTALDYLQVFELSLERNKGLLTLCIQHSQEVPEYEQELFWVIPETEEILKHKDKWNGKKLFVMDDGVAVVTLFPEER